MQQEVKIEVCVDSVESAIIAQKTGAWRVELCDNLIEGGTTPSAATIELARKYLDIKLHVIIRPRSGDFLYTDIEMEVIKRDVEIAKSLGVDGIVIGFLCSNGQIDEARLKLIIDLARPMRITFHRAFDVCSNPIQALQVLIDSNVDSLLTSGQKNKAEDGLELISDLVKKSAVP